MKSLLDSQAGAMFTATLILAFGKPVKPLSRPKIGETCAMDSLIRALLFVLLISQSPTIATAQDAAKKQEPASPTRNPQTTLEDGTPVKLRISQTASSADAHLNDRVEFEVLDDIRVARIWRVLREHRRWLLNDNLLLFRREASVVLI